MLTTLTSAAYALLFFAAPMGAPGCDANSAAAGLCATNSSTSLIVTGERNTPGTNPGSSPRSDPGDSSDGPTKPSRDEAFDQCLSNWDSMITCFDAKQPAAPVDPAAPAPPALPPITMNDLAAFAPDPVTTVGEPGNVGISGMPMNFVATASTHTRTGAIFGVPITVRFTPSGFDFRYGDGLSASTTTGGQSWAALGQAQFTPTPTSHVYKARGTYSVDVDVRYTAEIDIGLGWFPVTGELTTDGPSRNIRIFEAHTALVAYTCAQKPSSPGC